ncbi:hypothetical protein OG689_40100 [Kitasatospora sp. NBC_00240]|uniref:hypothetical protein n=1 Tax=Kitasatospora sp. NBC_00240 TaxID=2903567 RepID=UPI00225B0819|nr:hypothetical protein [Kitasatospora sp. NBC_00240]MCX5215383.1 hypothetical protein [Kitasatospora sp. NBC_00240]
MTDTDTTSPPSHDAHYLVATPGLYGWHVGRQPNGPIRLARPDWILTVAFHSHGEFRHPRAHGPAVENEDVNLVEILQQSGSPAPPA